MPGKDKDRFVYIYTSVQCVYTRMERQTAKRDFRLKADWGNLPVIIQQVGPSLRLACLGDEDAVIMVL